MEQEPGPIIASVCERHFVAGGSYVSPSREPFPSRSLSLPVVSPLLGWQGPDGQRFFARRSGVMRTWEIRSWGAATHHPSREFDGRMDDAKVRIWETFHPLPATLSACPSPCSQSQVWIGLRSGLVCVKSSGLDQNGGPSSGKVPLG